MYPGRSGRNRWNFNIPEVKVMISPGRPGSPSFLSVALTIGDDTSTGVIPVPSMVYPALRTAMARGRRMHARLLLTYSVTSASMLNDPQLPDKRTQDFANGKRVKAFSGFERSAEIRLDRLEAATSIKDLAALPGNFLEALKGD